MFMALVLCAWTHGSAVVGTAPSIFNAQFAPASGTSLGGTVTTDTTGGTIYAVVTQSVVQPTKAQIKSGLNASGGSADRAFNLPSPTAGTVTMSAGTLTGGIVYFTHWMHEKSAAQSNIATSPGFITSTGGVVRASSLTTISLTGNVLIDSLMWDKNFTESTSTPANTFTFSFPTGSTDGNPCGIFDYTSAASAGLKTAYLYAYKELAEIIPVTFAEMIEVSGTPGQHAQGMVYNWGVGGSSENTSSTFGPANNCAASQTANGPATHGTDTAVGQWKYWEAHHESGHQLSLSHPFDNVLNTHGVMPAAQCFFSYTVMAYASSPQATCNGANGQIGNTSAANFPTTVMVYDVRTLQQIFGTYTGGKTNIVHRWSQSTGGYYKDDTLQTPTLPTSNIIYMNVVDGSGTGIMDNSNYTTGLVADLTPGSVTSIFDSAQLATIDNGGTKAGFNVSISYSTQIKEWRGGLGNDDVRVNANSDTIDGGAGTNTVRFNDTFAHTTTGALSGGYCPVTNPVDGTVRIKNATVMIFTDPVTKTLNPVTCGLS